MLAKRDNAIQPWKPVRRAALIGGITVAEAAMLAIATAEYFPLIFLVPMGAAVFAAVGAGVSALIAYLLSLRHGSSLNNLETDLGKAAAIYERGLMDDAEYKRIKGQILETYHYTPGRSVDLGRAVRRGALLGLLAPVIAVLTIYPGGVNLMVALASGVVGALVSGSGKAALMFVQRRWAERQLEDGKHPLIDAG